MGSCHSVHPALPGNQPSVSGFVQHLLSFPETRRWKRGTELVPAVVWKGTAPGVSKALCPARILYSSSIVSFFYRWFSCWHLKMGRWCWDGPRGCLWWGEWCTVCPDTCPFVTQIADHSETCRAPSCFREPQGAGRGGGEDVLTDEVQTAWPELSWFSCSALPASTWADPPVLRLRSQ